MIIASHMINSDWKELLEGLHPLLVYSIAEIWWVWINESTTQDDITSIVPLYDATCSQYSVPSSTNRGGCTRASNFVPKNGTYESTALVSNNDVSLSDVPMPPLLLCSVLYYTDEWSRLHKSFKILRTADGPAASSLFCCFDTTDFYCRVKWDSLFPLVSTRWQPVTIVIRTLGTISLSKDRSIYGRKVSTIL